MKLINNSFNMVKINPLDNPSLKNLPERLNRDYKISAEKYMQSSSTISENRKRCLGKMVFHPESLPRMAWDILMLVLIIYQALTVPYFICFNDTYTKALILLDMIMSFIFFTDIVICFNTGFYYKGSLVMKRRAIAWEYLKMWFWIDVVASFPYNWVIEGITLDTAQNASPSIYTAPKILRIIRIFRFLRILRLLRLAKLKKILIKIEDYIASNTLANLFLFIRLLAMVFFIAHWTACFWFLIGSQDMLSHPITWVINAGIIDAPIFEQYITSLYWAFTTIATVGYGDITPVTLNEKLFAMMTMIMSSGVFAYTVGSIGSLISKQNAMENTYREQVVAVNSYMKKKSLPKSLQFRVRRYLDYIWEVKKKKKLDEKQVLSLLSEPLRDEIYAHINANVIKLCVVFDEYESYFIAQLTRTLENETYAPGDTIFAEGEISSKIYFILNGKIEIYHQYTLSTFACLSSKQYFGEIAFFTGTPRSASARCSEFVDLLSLIRLNFLSLLEKFPEAKEITKNLQKKCESGNYVSLNIHCYLCEELGHVAIKCKTLLVNLEQEDTRNHWLESKISIKKIRVKSKDSSQTEISPSKLTPLSPQIKLPYKRHKRKKSKLRYTGRNVIGVPRSAFSMFPEGSDLYPAIREAFDSYAQNDSGTSTRATNKDSLGVKPKERKKYRMFYINSDTGEEGASIQEFEKKSELKPSHTDDLEEP